MSKKPKVIPPSTKPKTNPGTYSVMLTGYTKPQFAHNAGKAGKAPIWRFDYWAVDNPKIVKAFQIEMDLDVCKKKNEKDQSFYMNELAKEGVKSLEKDAKTVNVVSVWKE